MIEVLRETGEILAVNKREGLPAIPGGRWPGPTALSEAEALVGRKLYVVHRLDKETSGVLAFAKDARTHRFLNEQFSQRRVRKTHLALVHGRMAATEGEIRYRLREFGSGRVGVDARRGKESITRYTVHQWLGGYSLVALVPHTGRHHQVRAHLYSIGHPIVGDSRYGSREASRAYPRLMLHAVSITLQTGPETEITVEAPIPESFRQVVELIARSGEAGRRPGA